MKIKIITANIIAIFIIILASISFAATGTVEFKSNTTEVKKGETFTVTLSATSKEGINGIDTKYTYDSEKLELVSENVADSSNWSNIGAAPEITIICNSTQSIKNADIYILTFKVKDNVSVGSTIKIEMTDILLDTDAQTDSEVTIPSKKIEITVKDSSENNSNEKNKDANEVDSEESKTKDTKTNTKTSINESDSNTAVKKLPKTGDNFVIIYGSVVLAIILSIVFYKKYMQHKDIK